MESIMLSVLQEPGVQQELMTLQTEEELAALKEA